MKCIRKITAVFLLAALFISTAVFADDETSETEEIKYDMTDAIDDCTDFETVYAVSDGIILDDADADNLTAFEGDYTFFQRTTSLDEWVIYEVPEQKQLEFVTYFWLGEEMVHFKFEYSKDGETWKKAYPVIDAKPPQAGKWTPVSYTLDSLPDDAVYVKIIFQNLNGVSWSPCIANVRAHSLGNVYSAFSDIAGLDCERAVSTLKNLGLIDGYSETEFAPENFVTRAEFCKMAVKFLGLSENGVTYTFADVPKSHWASGYISEMASQGYIDGVGNGNFEPEAEITLNQAVKIVVSMLGYAPVAQSGGSYPAGYNLMGSRLNLFKNISLSGDEAMTRGQAAILFKNASEAEVMYQTEYGDNSAYSYDGRTILNLYHNIYVIKGIVTDIGARSVTGADAAAENKILVGGEEYIIRDFDSKMLLGLNSTLYIKYDKNSGEGVLLYAYSDDTPIEIDYNDFIDYDGRTITYIDKDGREKRMSVNPNARIVYNGRYLTRAGISDSIDFSCGNMYLINNSGGNSVDIVMIENYDTYFITADSKLGYSLYDKYKGSVSFSYDGAKEIEVIKNGKHVEYDEDMVIGPNNIVQIAKSADGLAAKIYISGRYTEGAVSQVLNDKYIIDDNQYYLSEYFKNSGQTLSVGSGEAVVYLDINNNIVTSATGNSDFRYGYLQASAETGTLSNEVRMRIITYEGASEYTADGRTLLNGVKAKAESLTGLSRQLIRYKIRQSDNRISNIETALYNIGGVSANDVFSLDYISDSTIFRGGELNTFSGIYQLDNSAKVFYIPSDNTDILKYKSGGKELLSVDLNYKIEGFDLDKDYMLGAVVVYEDGSADEGLSYSANVMVVSDVLTRYDDNKGFYLGADGFVNGAETEIVFDENGAKDYTGSWNSSGKSRATVANAENLIRRGDVIQYFTDSSGVCTKVRFLYLAGQNEFFEKNAGDYGALSDENYYSELYVGVGTVKLKAPSKIMYCANDNSAVLRTLPLGSSSVYIYSEEHSTIKKADVSEISYGDKVFVHMNYSGAKEIIIIR